jgi:hypothetical protein
MDMFDYEALKFWWAVAITLGNVGVFLFTYFSTKDKGNETRIAAVETSSSAKFAKLDSRLVKVETEIEHMPSTSEMGVLQADMQGLKTGVQSMAASLTAMSRQLEIINQHLLSQST